MDKKISELKVLRELVVQFSDRLPCEQYDRALYFASGCLSLDVPTLQSYVYRARAKHCDMTLQLEEEESRREEEEKEAYYREAVGEE